MALFREQDRLKEDSRVLVITNPDDFFLYRKREKLQIKGIAMPYAISDAAAEAARFCATSPTVSKTRFNFDFGASKGSHFDQCVISDAQAELAPLLEISRDLTRFFQIATGANSTNSFRINSNYPNYFHQHRTAMSAGVLKSGTVCLNIDGKEYTIPNAYILLCEDIAHRAPSENPQQTNDDPRATFVVTYHHALEL